MHDRKLPHGSSFCLCRACGAYFMSCAAFERHRMGEYERAGDRACLPAPRLPSIGLELDARGYWRLPKREAPKIAAGLSAAASRPRAAAAAA